jgi:hypothetical protein
LVRLLSGKTYGVVARTHHAAITSNRNTSHAHIVLRDELVRTLILSQVPDSYVATTVAADEFALVWMDNHIVDGNTVGVVTLDVA